MGIPIALAAAAIVVGLVVDSASAAPARAVTGAPGPGRLSNADERIFSALTVEHRTVRGRLPPAVRIDLDRLTARVRDALFAPAPRATAWEDAKAAVRRIVPGFSEADTEVLAAYALEGIASGDLEVLRFAQTTPSFEALSGFKSQYLQMQQEMQRVSRGMNILSNLFNSDAAKTAISKVR
jgi:hypothetical protein